MLRRLQKILLLLLTLLLVGSALSVVTSQYQARNLFIQLERRQASAKQLDIDADQLQLDLSSLSTRARIEAKATQDLHMVPAGVATTHYVIRGE